MAEDITDQTTKARLIASGVLKPDKDYSKRCTAIIKKITDREWHWRQKKQKPIKFIISPC